MANPFHACEYEIEYLCGYIKDNGTIANYFGVPREFVTTVRSKMAPPRTRRRYLDKRAEPISTSSGLTASSMTRIDAESGSQRLNHAIQNMFRKFERRHGLQEGAGKILLPAGWGGWK